MGLYALAEKKLKNTFSMFQFMEVLGMEKENAREARNILRQFYQQGLIKRVSKNLYAKVKPSPKE